MSFNPQQLCCVLLAILVLPPCVAADAVDIEFKVTPDTCVSLQQGRTCYSKITAQWQSAEPLDLCLALENQVLHCWTQQQQGQHQFEFAAASGSKVLLLQQQQPVAQAKIEVNWVHKASKTKRHWRLF
jgi:hypothetical protein